MKKIIVVYIQNNDLIALNRQSNIISSLTTQLTIMEIGQVCNAGQ